MKKAFVFLLAWLLLLGLAACKAEESPNWDGIPSLEAAFCIPFTVTFEPDFSAYYDLSTANGLEVYVWQIALDEYRCGVLSGTNRLKTTEELDGLIQNSATTEEMRDILSSYDPSDISISFFFCWKEAADYKTLPLDLLQKLVE